MTSAFKTFFVIGSSTFALDYTIYLILLHLNMDLNVSKFIASFIAVVLGYYLNSKYNFGQNNHMPLLRLIF